MKKVLTYLLLPIIMLMISSIFMSYQVYAAENQKKIDLQTSPQDILFKVSNLKPGDFMVRELTVINEGEKKFTYTSHAEYKSGSEKLYDQLELKVLFENKILYDGKLSEFTGFPQKALDTQEKQDFTFRVDFPYETGNEFQGLGVEFDIILIAEGNESSVTPPIDSNTGGGLPQTGESNPIWYYLSGIMIAGLGVGVLRKSLKGDRPSIRIKR